MQNYNTKLYPEDQKAKEKFISDLVKTVTAEFIRRREERVYLERQWELNMNFLIGNQYCDLSSRGEIVDEDKTYFWQNRGVFNHIAPIMETRLAKLSRISPVISVRPRSDDDTDVTNSVLAEKVIEERFGRSDVAVTVRQATAWSETCGTSFYKVIWNADGGNKIGTLDGNPVYEGEVSFIPVSPFEIFPETLYTESLDGLRSLIHAKAVDVDDIRRMYGVQVDGEEIDVFSLSGNKTKGSNKAKRTAKNSAIVIEYYERPTDDYPNGRLITFRAVNFCITANCPT